LCIVKDKRYYSICIVKLLRNLPQLFQKMSQINHNTLTLPIACKFVASALSYPERRAIYVDQTFYTYSDLWKIVLSIYNRIPTNKTYTTIGIYCYNDVATYASIIAIGLYGAAYVPLNNKFPVIRNKHITEQCELELILSSEENDMLNELKGNAKFVFTRSSIPFRDEDASDNTNCYDAKSYQKVEQEYSCILFTSGTTGVPKGVPLSHKNLNTFFDFQLKNYDFNKEDRFLQVYELTFDVSIFSFLMPLLVGGCCYVVPDKGIKFSTIVQMLKEHKITIVSMVPALLNYLINYLPEIHLPDLRFSIFSGDALYHDMAVLWSKCTPNGVIENFYGPTETTIVCFRHPFEEQKSAVESVNGIVPIGKPFDGIEFKIVNEEGNKTDNGELCLRGTQVISHYLHHANPDKFILLDNKVWYKTGDVVTMNSNGNLCFLGRTDSQVKISGFRIELSEIEFALASITSKRTVVLCLTDQNKINSLHAFIETTEVYENEIKEQLATLLPYYMIPVEIIPVGTFPLNVNEKVDRNKLLLLSQKQKC